VSGVGIMEKIGDGIFAIAKAMAKLLIEPP
jgi:hypothetical protein